MSNATSSEVTLLDALSDRAKISPDLPFIIDRDSLLTYGDAYQGSARVAGALAAAGVKPGDRVCIALPNSPEFCLILYGVLHSGATAVLMNPRLTPYETQAAVTLARPKLSIGESEGMHPARGFLKSSENSIELRPNPSGIALMLLTSGTTGKPKAVMLSLEAVSANAHQLATRKKLTERDRFLCSIPLFHSNGQVAALQSMLMAGASLVLMDRFSPEALVESVKRYGITAISGVPTIYQQLVRFHESHPVDLSTLRLCISGSAPMPAGLIGEVEKRFGAFILEGYGLTECSAGAAGNPIHRRKVGTVGTALEGTKIQVVNDEGKPLAAGEVGEILIRGPQLMAGYFEDPEATASAFAPGHWLRSGDLGDMDSDGYITLRSRKKELIIRGGFNIYPAEVESVLRQIEGVQDVAIIGLPDASYGETVHCALITELGTESLPPLIHQQCVEKLARYKRPTTFSVHRDFPRTGVGKIQRSKLRELIQAEAGSVKTL